MSARINGVKVFAATMHLDRAHMGERVTQWLDEKRKIDGFELIERTVTQSSDHNFHCISITLWYFEPVTIQVGGRKLFK